MVHIYAPVKEMIRRMNELSPGDFGIVVDNLSENSLRRRFLDIGLINGALIECVGKSPFGDPKAYLIKGAVIAIRGTDSEKITVNVKTP